MGEELERNICEAWLRLRGKILSDPQELAGRLARRRNKSLTRPPRAWCVAIRASDRRITAAHWVISPEHAMDLDHPGHPYEPIEHEVTIQTHAIQRYCTPVSFSIAEAVDVARMLGVSNAMLLYARRRGRFFVDYEKGLGGKRGHPVPLISANRQLFDPSQRDFAPPHPVWRAQPRPHAPGRGVLRASPARSPEAPPPTSRSAAPSAAGRCPQRPPAAPASGSPAGCAGSPRDRSSSPTQPTVGVPDPSAPKRSSPRTHPASGCAPTGRSAPVF